MRKTLRRRSLLALGLCACLGMGTSQLAGAASGQGGEASAAPGSESVESKAGAREARSGGASPADAGPKRTVGPRSGKIIVAATDLFTAGRYAEAEAELEKLRPRGMNPYERALANRLHASIAYAREQTDAAIAYLQQAIEDEGLPRSDQIDVLFQIAQLQSVQQRWQDVVATMQQWMSLVDAPNPVAYHLLALAHYQLKDLDAALVPARLAVETAEKPHQSAIQLLLAIYLTRKDYREATPLLVQLLTLYPGSGRAAWLQLSSLYGVQEDVERALAVLELAHRQGLLTEEHELRQLAQLMLYKEMPVRTARLVEEALERQAIQGDAAAYELLSSSWLVAREAEQAEGPLARAAALAEKGDLYLRLGQLHLVQQEWSEAAAAFKQALDKGGLADPGATRLLLGVAYFNADEFYEARRWFQRALESGSVRSQAESWLEQVERELSAKPGESQTASVRD